MEICSVLNMRVCVQACVRACVPVFRITNIQTDSLCNVMRCAVLRLFLYYLYS